MKIRMLIVTAILAATGIPASAQSVSGLSAKNTPAPADRLVAALKDAIEALQKEGLLLPMAADEMRNRVTEDGTEVNLAVPAGAVAALNKDGAAAAGPKIGFQAWKADDFFAGGFFTFDTAPTLNGDARKAAVFLRDPPNAGTSFLVSGSRMFQSYRCGGFRPVRWDKDEVPTDPCDEAAHGEKRDALIIGMSMRAGATSTTLEHKLAATEGRAQDVERHDATILHASLSLLVTSRTFRSTRDNGEYQFGLELGVTGRQVGGDAASQKEFLAQPDVFGHASTSFVGFDGTFFVRLNGFQPFVRITHIPKRNGKHVPGLTGLQASLGINVLTALFQTANEAPPQKR